MKLETQHFHKQNQKKKCNLKTTQSENELFIQHNTHSCNFHSKITALIQNLPHSLMVHHSTTYGLQLITLTITRNWC
jgi:hypothetical protein